MFLYQSNAGFKEWFDNLSSVSNVLEEFIQIVIILLKMLEFSSEAILARSFLCRKCFYLNINLLNKFRTIHVIYSWMSLGNCLSRNVFTNFQSDSHNVVRDTSLHLETCVILLMLLLSFLILIICLFIILFHNSG